LLGWGGGGGGGEVCILVFWVFGSFKETCLRRHTPRLRRNTRNKEGMVHKEGEKKKHLDTFKENRRWVKPGKGRGELYLEKDGIPRERQVGCVKKALIRRQPRRRKSDRVILNGKTRRSTIVIVGATRTQNNRLKGMGREKRKKRRPCQERDLTENYRIL